MVRTADGYWHTQLELPTGEFKFRYLADGQWYVDYAGFGLEYGTYGPDSIVRIPSQDRQSRNKGEKLPNSGNMVA